MLPGLAANLLQHIFSIYVQPELARRVQAGTPVPPGTPLFAIQAIFRVDRDAEVRLNEQVRGVLEARAKRPLAAGEPVNSNDISRIDAFHLAEADADAAHITALQFEDGWGIAWDGRYNAILITGHLESAQEFVALAEYALEHNLLRGFAENAFAAAELLGKALLLRIPDQRLLTARTHNAIKAEFNRWGKLGITDTQFPTLLNELGALRSQARYVRGDINLPRERAEEMLVTLRSLQAHAIDVSPRTYLRELRDRRAG